jgi:hypothetical protein
LEKSGVPADVPKSRPIPAGLTPENLMPQNLAGGRLRKVSPPQRGFSATGLVSIKGAYSNFELEIAKAQNDESATAALGEYLGRCIKTYEENMGDPAGRVSSGPGWIAWDDDDIWVHETSWRNGCWLFRVFSEDRSSRGKAAQGLADYLNQLY